VGRTIEISIRARASIEQAWAAWTDLQRLSEWFPDRATGAVAAGQVVTYEWDALGMKLPLQVVEARPKQRLVLHTEPPGLGPQSQTITFHAAGDSTEIVMTHSGFDDDDIFHGTASGWHITLEFLREYLEHHYAQPRVNAWILGLAPIALDRVYAYYTGESELEAWLTNGGAVGREGDEYRLELADGGSMSGRVLTRYEPREVACTWQEINGVIAFRTFSVADGAALVGVHMASWNRSRTELAPIATNLRSAVDRLVQALGGTSALA
jgi:uncharacterized protein YndB with AHSA1/START domain